MWKWALPSPQRLTWHRATLSIRSTASASRRMIGPRVAAKSSGIVRSVTWSRGLRPATIGRPLGS